MMDHDQGRLLELTPQEQQEADREAAMLEMVRKMNAPNAPSVMELFPGAIVISDLVDGASAGKLYRVKNALKNGDDVNGRCMMFGTALHVAASNGHLEVVKLLVACGADTQVRDDQGNLAADVASKPGIAESLRSRNQ